MKGFFRGVFSWPFLRAFASARTLSILLASYGSLWLIVEISAFFFSDAGTEIRKLWWLFLALGLFASLASAFPRLSRSCRMAGRDVLLEIRVGDFFDQTGDWIVGSNTTFESSLEPTGPISVRSLQGQLTKKYYNTPNHLAADIAASLKASYGAMGQAGPEYSLGSVAAVKTAGGLAYLVAIARMNSANVAHSSLADLQVALPGLWEYIANRGNLNTLVIPILGSGFGRIKETREQIAHEIIRSFVAACSSARFTDHLIVVVSYSDFAKNRIDLDRLGRYVEHVCTYTQIGTSAQGGGVAVP